MWGADRFVLGASALARNLGVSPLVIGLTIVGFGTSAPEMLVSAVAAWTGSAELSVGNAIGSNITNIALVLGAAALVNPLEVHSKIIRREIPLLLAIMGLAAVLMHDFELDRIDGAIFLGGLFLMIGWIVREGLSQRDSAEPDAMSGEFEGEIPDDMSTSAAILWLIVGLAVLLASSRALVWGAVNVARYAGVDELVIGLTVVAFGTSLPELAASIVAARRNEHDIAVGNVIGSNMFNVLGVLGIAASITTERFSKWVMFRDFPAMIGVTVLLLILARGFRPKSIVTRPQGALLVVSFLAYVSVLYWHAMQLGS